MSFAITDWNLNPNQNWYVVISDSGTGIQVDLYTTQTDAETETNLTASGSGEYGTGCPVALTMADGGSPEISFFNSALDYHIAVMGQSGDASKIYHVAPFVDLPDVNNGVYQSSALIQKRALHEINLHTHTSRQRSLTLAGPFPNIIPGGILRIQSDMRSIDVLTTVTETVITGTPDSLTAQVETVEYVDFVFNG